MNIRLIADVFWNELLCLCYRVLHAHYAFSLLCAACTLAIALKIIVWFKTAELTLFLVRLLSLAEIVFRLSCRVPLCCVFLLSWRRLLVDAAKSTSSLCEVGMDNKGHVSLAGVLFFCFVYRVLCARSGRTRKRMHA